MVCNYLFFIAEYIDNYFFMKFVHLILQYFGKACHNKNLMAQHKSNLLTIYVIKTLRNQQCAQNSTRALI